MSIEVSTLHTLPPYGMAKEEKQAFLTEELKALSLHHATQCPEYARMLDAVGCDPAGIQSFEELPPLPPASRRGRRPVP